MRRALDLGERRLPARVLGPGDHLEHQLGVDGVAGPLEARAEVVRRAEAVDRRRRADLRDEVEAGAPIVVVEAMKMENELSAPKAGTVQKLHVAQGDTVEGGARLVTVA